MTTAAGRPLGQDRTVRGNIQNRDEAPEARPLPRLVRRLARGSENGDARVQTASLWILSRERTPKCAARCEVHQARGIGLDDSMVDQSARTNLKPAVPGRRTSTRAVPAGPTAGSYPASRSLPGLVLANDARGEQSLVAPRRLASIIPGAQFKVIKELFMGAAGPAAPGCRPRLRGAGSSSRPPLSDREVLV